ncbi:MAG: hypothetical protein IPH45_20680 [Bacteroidales bacterium]|nr:hypothetical protein [Bacteroidales bacterium]
MKTIFTLKNSVQLKQESSINGILYLFTTFVLIILSFRGEAQLSKYVHNPSSEINAKDINIAVQSYLDSLLHTSDSSLIMNEGGEYENFQDFKQFWGERLFSEGDFDNYFQSQKQFYSNTINDYSIYNNEPWHELGPTTSSYGIGPVEFVSFYDDGTPLSTKYMLTGSLNNGLFYSSDAGEHWNSTGSDTKWNSSGCGWAVFHPTNHSIWFASSSENLEMDKVLG